MHPFRCTGVYLWSHIICCHILRTLLLFWFFFALPIYKTSCTDTLQSACEAPCLSMPQLSYMPSSQDSKIVLGAVPPSVTTTPPAALETPPPPAPPPMATPPPATPPAPLAAGGFYVEDYQQCGGKFLKGLRDHILLSLAYCHQGNSSRSSCYHTYHILLLMVVNLP